MSSWFADLSSKLSEQVQQATQQLQSQASERATQYFQRNDNDHEDNSSGSGTAEEDLSDQNMESYLAK